MAGGNKHFIHLINELNKRKEIDTMNQKVVERFKDAQPFLIDVVPAVSVIPELNGKVLLHAGPPIEYKGYDRPDAGVPCIGAILFEHWCETEEGKSPFRVWRREIHSMPPCTCCRSDGSSITSANMPVMVVENRLDGTRAYCIMNEGIGKVLRFGAYSKGL